MIAADYSHLLLSPNILLITDLKNEAKASLTNSITMVLQELYKKGVDWKKMKVLQKDSEGCFSEVIVTIEGRGNIIHTSWRHLSDNSLLDALKIISQDEY